MRIITLIAVLLALSFSAAAQPADAELEARAHEISRALRCVVCQNQSIDESDAPLAADMRKLVRDRLKAGDSNADVIGYMQERYGDYVLLKPPVQSNTYALWFLPFIFLLTALSWFFLKANRAEEDT